MLHLHVGRCEWQVRVVRTTATTVAVDLGEVLTARSTEVSRSKKIATYRVDITRGDGKLVAAFTGTAYLTGHAHAAHLRL